MNLDGILIIKFNSENLKEKANDKIDELSNITAADWEKFKSDLDSFIDDLESDFKSLVEEGDKLESEM